MNENENMIPETEESAESEAPKKRRGGRKPKAEDQEGGGKPHQVFLQYQDIEVEVGELMESARAAFREEKKRTPIKDLKLYIKPEERAAYFVINEKFNGKVDF